MSFVTKKELSVLIGKSIRYKAYFNEMQLKNYFTKYLIEDQMKESANYIEDDYDEKNY